jgi:hypothetical protein
VGPAQLSPQRGDNCFVGERLRKLHHPVKIFLFKASAEVGYQLSRQRGDNLLSIRSAFVPQDLAQDSIADPPIERSESDVNGCRRLPASVFNQIPDLVQQIAGITRFHHQLGFCHLYPFTMSLHPVRDSLIGMNRS